MTAVETPDARRVAFGIVLGQACLTGVVAALCWIFASANAALSAAIGGSIGAVASLVLALVAFRRGDRDLGRITRAFYLGEAAKLGVVVVLFILVLTTIRSRMVPGALLGTYTATFFVYWVALARVRSALVGEQPRGDQA